MNVLFVFLRLQAALKCVVPSGVRSSAYTMPRLSGHPGASWMTSWGPSYEEIPHVGEEQFPVEQETKKAKA